MRFLLLCRTERVQKYRLDLQLCPQCRSRYLYPKFLHGNIHLNELQSGKRNIFHLFLYSLDLDPCLNVTCYFHGLCKAFGPRDARCMCIDHCPSYHEPVCSSNGTTYDNECLFKQEMCRMRLNFTVQHPGSCEGRAHLLPPMLMIADYGRCIGIL